MNRYQKALNKIVKSCCPNCHDENGCSTCDIEKTCNCTAKSWVDTLQELIDKETIKEQEKQKNYKINLMNKILKDLLELQSMYFNDDNKFNTLIDIINKYAFFVHQEVTNNE